jgi:hypothetical protein
MSLSDDPLLRTDLRVMIYLCEQHVDPIRTPPPVNEALGVVAAIRRRSIEHPEWFGEADSGEEQCTSPQAPTS